MSLFSIDLSQLPPPVQEPISYQGILAVRQQGFVAQWEAARVLDPTLPTYDVSSLEFDPITINLENASLNEVLVRQNVVDAKKGTFLAWATGADLVNRAADFGTVAAPGESPDSLRLRARFAWEALATGGTYGGYFYGALSAAPTDIADIQVYGAEIPGVPRGEVHIVVLPAGPAPVLTETLRTRILARFPRNPAAGAAIGDGQPPVYLVTFPGGTPLPLSDMLSARVLALVGNPGRKVNDTIVVRGPNVCPYRIDATLIINRGVDPQTIVAAQRQAVLTYASKRTAIAGKVTPSHVEGKLVTEGAGVVVDCVLRQPAAPVGGGPFDVPWLTGIALDWVYAS